MNFSTLEFFFFLITLLGFWFLLSPFVSHRLLLLVGSWAFYASWNPVFLLMLIASTVANYVVGWQLEKESARLKRRYWLVMSLFFNLGPLFFFKYACFAIETFNDLGGMGWPIPEIILPMGISFYTFQALSYILDIYRGDLKAHRSFVDFALFVAFFPQLVAGPIVRASSFLPQIKKKILLSWENTSWALQRFIWGLSKKLLIADQLGQTVDSIYAYPESFSAHHLIFATIFFTIQLYIDFSAYSDMAIALARFFGFHIPENFNNPFFARNISDFWRRWHISLSTWLKDYLYISLGGNRGSLSMTCRNLMITMILGGLWHGAAWGFAIWGFYHGLLLVLFRLFKNITLPAPISRIFTFLLITFGFLFFRATHWHQTQIILSRITDFLKGKPLENPLWVPLEPGLVLTGLVLGGCLFFHLGWHRLWAKVPVVLQAILIAFLLWLTLVFCPPEERPFYYFIF